VASENGSAEQKQFISALAPSPEAISKICSYFYNGTRELIEQTSFPLVGENTRAVNIVRDVLKYVPLRWAATEVVCLHLTVPRIFSDDYDHRLELHSRHSNTLMASSLSLNYLTCFLRFISQF
jgi:hypothetical protein